MKQNILKGLKMALTENKITKLIELPLALIPETEEEKATFKKLIYKLAEQYANGSIKF